MKEQLKKVFFNAIMVNDFEGIEILTESDLSVFSKDSSNRTALHWASYFGHNELVEYFIEKGIDVEARDDEGKTALDTAIISKFSNKKTITLLKQQLKNLYE